MPAGWRAPRRIAFSTPQSRRFGFTRRHWDIQARIVRESIPQLRPSSSTAARRQSPLILYRRLMEEIRFALLASQPSISQHRQRRDHTAMRERHRRSLTLRGP